MVSLHEALWRKWVIKVKQHKSNGRNSRGTEGIMHQRGPPGHSRQAEKVAFKGHINNPSLWVGINKAEIQEEGSVDEAVTLSLPQRAGGGARRRHNEALEADK